MIEAAVFKSFCVVEFFIQTNYSCDIVFFEIIKIWFRWMEWITWKIESKIIDWSYERYFYHTTNLPGIGQDWNTGDSNTSLLHYQFIIIVRIFVCFYSNIYLSPYKINNYYNQWNIKNWNYINISKVKLTIFNSTSIMRTSKGQKLSWNYPIEISIFNSLLRRNSYKNV